MFVIKGLPCSQGISICMGPCHGLSQAGQDHFILLGINFPSLKPSFPCRQLMRLDPLLQARGFITEAISVMPTQ